MSTEARRAHWDGVYATKAPEDVSWRQEVPELSLRLIKRLAWANDAPIVDIGAGATTLIDELLIAGYSDVTALDISKHALDHIAARLKDDRPRWVVADVTQWRAPSQHYAIWHDRAVLHFLRNADDQTAYADTLRTALASGGHAIISGFAPGGPEKCSGMSVVQHDAESLSALLGDEFELIATEDETHVTPRGTQQAFRYHVFQRQ